MAMTLAEKIVARAAGRERVTPGEIVTCAVDLAMIHDSGGPRRVAPILKRFGVGLWDPSKVVLISDHYVPAGDDETRRIGEVTRAIRGRAQARRLLRQRRHLPRRAAGARASQARHVRGRRRQPFADRRRVRRLHVRHRRDRDGGRAGDRRDLARGARDDRDRMARPVRSGRGRQGRDAVPVRPARHGRRPHAGGALPRRGDPRAADAGAHDARPT